MTAAAEADGTAHRTRPLLIVVLWLAGLGAAAQYGKVAVVFDMLPALFPGAGAAIGWAVSLVGLVGIVLGVVAGVVVAQIGLRRALLIGLAGGALLSALQALTLPFAVFLGLRVVEGVFHLAIVVAAPTLISQVASVRHRGLALTFWGTFFGVAFALIAALGIPLAVRHGLPALFLAHAGWMAACGALLTVLLPRDAPVQEAWPNLTSVFLRSGRLYRSARIGAPAWGWLCYTFSFVSLLTLVPPFLPDAARIATLTAMPLVSIASSLILGVALLRVLSSVTVIEIGFVAAAAGMLALLVWPGSPVLCLFAAAALGLVQGASFAAVPELNDAPEDRALANGGLAQMGNLGNTIGVPVLAATIAAFGAPGLFLPLAVALTAGAGLHTALARRRRAGAA